MTENENRGREHFQRININERKKKKRVKNDSTTQYVHASICRNDISQFKWFPFVDPMREWLALGFFHFSL